MSIPLASISPDPSLSCSQLLWSRCDRGFRPLFQLNWGYIFKRKFIRKVKRHTNIWIHKKNVVVVTCKEIKYQRPLRPDKSTHGLVILFLQVFLDPLTLEVSKVAAPSVSWTDILEQRLSLAVCWNLLGSFLLPIPDQIKSKFLRVGHLQAPQEILIWSQGWDAMHIRITWEPIKKKATDVCIPPSEILI